MKSKKVEELICDWPGCTNPMFCRAGNAKGAYVCQRHLQITNGKTWKEFLPHELEALLIMADNVDNREKA